MIEETYVSFEVAKLLKEKGFDIPVYTFYEEELYGPYDYQKLPPKFKENRSKLRKWNEEDDERGYCYSAPTHQMVLKWLRDVHGIMISVSTYTNYDDETKHYWSDYGSHIISLSKHDLLCDVRNEADTYEEATEKAINYCLCNLIGDSLDKLIKKI